MLQPWLASQPIRPHVPFCGNGRVSHHHHNQSGHAYALPLSAMSRSHMPLQVHLLLSMHMMRLLRIVTPMHLLHSLHLPASDA